MATVRTMVSLVENSSNRNVLRSFELARRTLRPIVQPAARAGATEIERRALYRHTKRERNECPRADLEIEGPSANPKSLHIDSTKSNISALEAGLKLDGCTGRERKLRP